MQLLLRIVRIVLVAGLSMALLLAGGLAWAFSSMRIDTTDSGDFSNPLAIPPLADSRVEEGRRMFDLTLQAGQHDFGEGRDGVPTWGFNGTFLGPTVRVRDGEEVGFRIRNTLDEESSVHWHGMHVPAKMDGGPHQPVAAGGTWEPHWQVDQEQATLWYHPHPHGRTAQHVYRGLAGMLIVDPSDPAVEERLGLPHEYGVDDIPVIVQDRTFSGNRLDESPGAFRSTGVLGDTMVVNGTLDPHLEVTTEQVRLRLLNGSNARVMAFGFHDGRTFTQVASDGGLLPAAHQTTRLTLSPGERAEVVVTMAPAERAVLRTFPIDVGGTLLQQRWAGGDDTMDVLELRAADTLRPAPPLATHLSDLAPPDEPSGAVQREFELLGVSINGQQMDMDRIDAQIPVGSTEVWTIRNRDAYPHNFHIHDVQFRVLDVSGRHPGPELSGRKDTVFIPPGTSVRLLVGFEDHADADTPYMFHCHLLLHEDLGMMGQFLVLPPGTEPTTPTRIPSAAVPADSDGHAGHSTHDH